MGRTGRGAPTRAVVTDRREDPATAPTDGPPGPQTTTRRFQKLVIAGLISVGESLARRLSEALWKADFRCTGTEDVFFPCGSEQEGEV